MARTPWVAFVAAALTLSACATHTETAAPARHGCIDHFDPDTGMISKLGRADVVPGVGIAR
jgi:hypothetical protein